MPSYEQKQKMVTGMLKYLDKEGVLVDYEEVKRRRDGEQAWKVRLMMSPEFYGSTRSAYDYLSGACDVVTNFRSTLNPRTKQ